MWGFTTWIYGSVASISVASRIHDFRLWQKRQYLFFVNFLLPWFFSKKTVLVGLKIPVFGATGRRSLPFFSPVVCMMFCESSFLWKDQEIRYKSLSSGNSTPSHSRASHRVQEAWAELLKPQVCVGILLRAVAFIQSCVPFTSVTATMTLECLRSYSWTPFLDSRAHL